MGVVGAAIKGFGKALKTAKRNKASKQVFDHIKGKSFPESTQRHMRASSKRHAGMKKAGYKGPIEVEIFSAENWWKRDGNEVLETILSRFANYV